MNRFPLAPYYWHLWCTVSYECVREFSRQLEKALKEVPETRGNMIHDKIFSKKISWHCPHKPSNLCLNVLDCCNIWAHEIEQASSYGLTWRNGWTKGTFLIWVTNIIPVCSLKVSPVWCTALQCIAHKQIFWCIADTRPFCSFNVVYCIICAWS